MERLAEITIGLFFKVLEFFSFRKWTDNLQDVEGGELKVEKGKTVFIIAVSDNKGGIARLATHSLDLFKKTVRKLNDKEVFYIARRDGNRFANIQAVSVFNRRIGEVTCRLDVAFMRLTNQSIRT